MVGPDSSHGVSRVVHHKDYYLRGGDVTFLVENHLYRIHSYFFDRESLFFRQKFCSNNNGEEQPGSTDSNAFTLEDTKSEDFARFLWVFYNPKYSVYEAPLETWLSILKLANRWTFDSVKELSVRELEKLEIEPIEKIAIYHDHNISRLYLVPSYICVCKRDKPLSFSEGMKLGMETVLRIAEARERLRLLASESGIRTPTFEDFEDNEVETLVREIFNLGLRPGSPNPTSPAGGVNGAANGTQVKLGPPPLGNPSKANGAPAHRTHGGSVADPRGSSVDSMPSFGAVLATQDPATAPAPAPATLAAATPATGPSVTEPQRTALPEQRPPVPPAKTTSPSQPPAAEATDKAKDQEGPKSGGEPSSSADSGQLSSNHDVSNSKPVVSPTEQSDDVTATSKDNVNDAEKDNKLGKENDAAGVASDNDALKSGGRNRKGKSQRGGLNK